MEIQTKELHTAGTNKAGLCIYNFEKLGGGDAVTIREEVEKAFKAGYRYVYIDAKDADDADLAGINEVIHANFSAQQNGSKLVFVYRKKTVIEKWVETTRLDKFVTTAILPTF